MVKFRGWLNILSQLPHPYTLINLPSQTSRAVGDEETFKIDIKTSCAQSFVS